MNEYKNILVVVDGDPNPETNLSIKRAIETVEHNKGRITLIDVIDSPDELSSDYKGMFSVTELFDMSMTQREKELEEVAQKLNELGLNVSYKVAAGRAFIEIIRQMLIGNHDLLIKVANSSSEKFAGNDFHLMRKCPQPVWLVQPGSLHYPTDKTLAAIDLKQEEYEEGRRLNRQILDLATGLSAQNGSELHVISCWELYGASALRHSAFLRVPESNFNAILSQEKKHYSQVLERVRDDYRGIAMETHLLNGMPTELIPKFVEDNSISTVVMGTVARTGIPGLFIGNTAETILQNIDTSVITVKPDGFITPIEA